MALFRSNKDSEKVNDAMREFRRAQSLAHQSTQQAEQQIGMSVQDMTAGMAAAQQSGEMASMLAYRNRAARVFQRGVEQPATLRSIELGQHNPMFGGMPAQVHVTVEPAGGAPYEVHTDQVMDQAMVQTLTAGQPVTVKVDPDDPQCLIIWAAAAATTTAPADDGSAQLAKLEELRAAGVLTEEEFQVQKAKLPTL
jgi:hypothetical protein